LAHAPNRLFEVFARHIDVGEKHVKKYSPVSVAIAVLLFVSAAEAQTMRAVQRGETIVQTYCAQCHAVGKSGSSALSVAPPLRDLHKLYPVEHLEEAFAEGITTGHPEMPKFQLEPGQIEDLIAYLKSLE
jgi:mono/diheme cytochrome c family protein